MSFLWYSTYLKFFWWVRSLCSRFVTFAVLGEGGVRGMVVGEKKRLKKLHIATNKMANLLPKNA